MNDLNFVLTRFTAFFIRETKMSYGKTDYSKKEVEMEAQVIANELKSQAYGFLANYQSEIEDTLEDATIEKIGGDFTGSTKFKVTLEVPVYTNGKIFLSEILLGLEDFYIYQISLFYLLNPSIQNLNNLISRRLRDHNHKILKMNTDKGLYIKLNNDLNTWIECTDNQVKLTLDSKYRFRFYEYIRQFPIEDFIKTVLLRDRELIPL